MGDFARLTTPGEPDAFSRGIDEVKAADRDYASATTLLACLRRDVGLGQVPEFKQSGGCPVPA